MTSNANKVKIREDQEFLNRNGMKAYTTIDEIPEKGAINQEFIDRMAKEEDMVESEIPNTIEDVDPDRFIIKTKNSERFDYLEFAQWLLNDSGERFATIEGSKEIYHYEDGIYVPGGNTLIGKTLKRIMMSNYANIRNHGEVAHLVRMDMTFKRDEFDADIDIINMENGLYHISDSRFEPHTPDYLSLSKTHVKYNVDAKCPTIDKFILETVEPHRVDSIYEISGYTQLPEKNLKRAVIFVGEPDTGKSTMLSLIAATVGKSKRCDMLPTRIEESNHSTYSFYGKLLNRVDDLGERPITDTGILKSLISSESIECEPKYASQFSFIPNVLVLFGCNQVPVCDDPYMRGKFDILMFNNQHTDDAANLNMFEDLTTDEEMSGFFNKSMVAVKIAIANKMFTGGNTFDDRDKVYEHLSNPIARFVEEECDLSDTNAMIEKKIFRKAYVEWSKANNIKVRGVGEQTTYLQDKGVMLSRVGGRDEERVRMYVGVDILTQDDHLVSKFVSKKNNEEKQDTDSDSGSVVRGGLHSDSIAEKKYISREKTMGHTPGHGSADQGTDSEKMQIKKVPPIRPRNADTPSDSDDDFEPEVADRIKAAMSTIIDCPCDVEAITKATRGLARTTVFKYLTLYSGKLNIYKEGESYAIRQ